MRIAVFGTGGVGGYFGARLAKSGHDLVFVARGEHLRAIQSDGLRVDSILGDFVVAPAQATDDPQEVGEVDVVLLGVKAWQVEGAAKSLRALIGSETCVLPLQNGIEAPEQVAAELGVKHVLGGLCGVFAFIAAPGHIKHVALTEPFVTFGELDNRPSARTSALLAAFQEAGLKAEIPLNIQAAMWQKLILISSLSVVGALTRTPVGVWRTVSESQKMYRDVVREAQTVALAKGVAVSDEYVETVMNWPGGLESTATTSLQRDLAEGRPSELEQQIGVVVRVGQDVGVDPALFSFAYTSLLPGESVARGTIDVT